MTTPIANYLMPGNIRFGFGAVNLTGQEAARLGGTHAFIITDPGVVAAGLVEPVVAALSAAGLAHTLFTCLLYTSRCV